MNCYNCGAATEPAQKFCEGCGAKVTTEHSGAHRLTDGSPGLPGSSGSPSANGGSPSGQRWPGTQPAASPPPAAVLRQYRAVQLRTRKRGEGTLYVTDARIVFYARAQGRATQRASALVQQTRLQDVCGLQAFVSRRTSVMLIVLTAFMALFALGSLAAGAVPFSVAAALAGPERVRRDVRPPG